MKRHDETLRSHGAVQEGFVGIVRADVEEGTSSLDRSIAGILGLVREELVMDIVFVSRQAGTDWVVSHATADPDEAGIQGMTYAGDQSFCQRILDGRLPEVMPDVASLRSTHDMPATPPINPGAYMATPVWLQCGNMYGILCCLSVIESPELGERHHQRLKMSARQIARLIDEAGES